MMPIRAHHQDSGAFLRALEATALGLRDNYLLHAAIGYHNHGLPQVALELGRQIDNPQSIQNIAKYLAFFASAKGLGFTGHEESLDKLLDDDGILASEEAVQNTLINSARIDPDFASIIEVQIATGLLISNLTVGNTIEIIKQADRLSVFTDDAKAQYASALAYASLGMQHKATAGLHRLLELAVAPFPDSSYLDSVRSEEAFKALKTRGIIVGNAELEFAGTETLSYPTLAEDQIKALTERSNKIAREQNKPFILRLLSNYIVYCSYLGSKEGNFSYFKNAEDAANKAVEIFGLNEATARLLAIIYNRTNRQNASIELLLPRESEFSPRATLELATAFALSGDYNAALPRLDNALQRDPTLSNLLRQNAYSRLRFRIVA